MGLTAKSYSPRSTHVHSVNCFMLVILLVIRVNQSRRAKSYPPPFLDTVSPPLKLKFLPSEVVFKA